MLHAPCTLIYTHTPQDCLTRNAMGSHSLILNFQVPVLSPFQATTVHMKPVEIKGPFPLHFLA